MKNLIKHLEHRDYYERVITWYACAVVVAWGIIEIIRYV